MYANMGFWAFQAIGAICLFVVFLPCAIYFGSRQKEREAYYKSETMRRITESTGEGAKVAIDMLREEHRMQQMKQREGVKIGGLVTLAVGIGLSIFLWTMNRGSSFSPWPVGLIPALVGLSMLVYVLFLAESIDGGPRN